MDAEVSVDRKKELIKKQPVFSQFTAEEVEQLADLLVEKHFSSGETIVTEGDLVDSVYLIISGTADVRHVSIRDNALHIQSVATLIPGQAIGLNDYGFYSLSGIRTATVVAITDMVTLNLSMAKFHGFSLANPHVNEVMRKHGEAYLKVKSD